MAVDLNSSTGIFTFIGACAGIIRNANGFRGSTIPSPGTYWGIGGQAIHDLNTAFNTLITTVPTGNKSLVDGIYGKLKSFRDNVGSPLAGIRSMAVSYVVEVVNADTKLPQKTLVVALTELRRQMIASSDTLKRNTVSAAVVANGSNIGDTQVLCSAIGPNGLTREFAFPEALKVSCTTDKNSGATAGSERLSVSGVAAVSDALSYLWPGGSGATGTVTVCDFTQSAKNNVLSNSGFESFTSNVPDSWTLLVGVAGASVIKSTTVLHSSLSSGSLQIVGDGAELTSITQNLTLKPQKAYALLGWCKVSAVPSTGVAKLELIDGSNTVINDDQGTANAITVTLTGQTSSYAAFSGWFRTPTNLPATVKLRLRLTTAIESGKSAFFDDMAMTGPVSELYPGGPLLAAFRGTADPISGDYWTVTVSNTLSAFYGAQSAGVLQTGCEVLFGMRSLGIVFPSTASTPTVLDSLVA